MGALLENTEGTLTQPTAEQLRLAREIVRKHYPEMTDDYSGRRVSIVLDAIQATEARMAAAVEALEPFSKALEKRQLLCKDDEFVTWSAITVGDLRKARQALAKIRSQSDG